MAGSVRSGRSAIGVFMCIALFGGLVPGGCGDTPEEESSPTPVPFTYVEQEIFVKSCVFSTCHAGPSGGGDLVLAPGEGYDNLVNVASSQVPEVLRVAPGDPDASYIMWKLEGTEGIVGTGMPQGGQLEADRIAAVRSWIEGGALAE